MDEAGKWGSWLWVTKDKQDDMRTVLNYLPELVQDHGRLTEVVASLVNVVIQQQQQMQNLAKTIESVAHAKLAVQLASDMGGSIERMVMTSSAAIKRASFESTFQAEESVGKKRVYSETIREKTLLKRSRKLSGKFKDLTECIASLNLGTDFSRRENNEAASAYAEETDTTVTQGYSGQMKLEFQGIVPGAPIVPHTEMHHRKA
jgi:hypothetical protein